MSRPLHATTRAALDERWDELRALDASEGTLALIVVRPSESVRVKLPGTTSSRW